MASRWARSRASTAPRRHDRAIAGQIPGRESRRPAAAGLGPVPIEAYRRRYSKVLVRNPPPCTVEFSRGCLFGCDYCTSKNTMGFGHRRKSPERCADELEHLEKLGYREALLTDDIFTSNRAWAIQVCEAIIRRNLKMVWTRTNGIRVDSATDELFRVMRRAGCYRVHFGFESGNDRVLKAFGKGGRASLAQGIAAVDASRRAGLDTWGMYMLGLSADDEASMRDTIEFAKRTNVDVAKFSICASRSRDRKCSTHSTGRGRSRPTTGTSTTSPMRCRPSASTRP